MLRSLVGAEMCIRDRAIPQPDRPKDKPFLMPVEDVFSISGRCLLYTSDAADEEDSVDLRGRSFIQAEDGIRDAQESRGRGDVYKRQGHSPAGPSEGQAVLDAGGRRVLNLRP